MSGKQVLKLILVGGAIAGAAEVGYELGKGYLLGCMLYADSMPVSPERMLYNLKYHAEKSYRRNLILFMTKAVKDCHES